MRPRILEIEGLQSFREKQRVNFDILGETGLFGIFGPTGSGKSTVLDAITFALYGKVKRAERGTQGIINMNMDTARVTFTFELQKDAGRRIYRVERVYQRKKGSINSCEPRLVRLIEVSDTGDKVLCDKASEVGGNIEELIGLSHDDFTRAVVLPQNSFQEFLLLDNSKKRDMLERIFYLEEYGKQLGDKLLRKMTALKSRIDVLSGELAGYCDATDEAVTEAEKSLESALKEKLRVEKELKLLEARHNEAKEVWQLTEELSQVVKREAQHNEAKAEMDEKRFLLDKAMKGGGVQEIVQTAKNSASKLRETDVQIEELSIRLSELAGNLELIQKEHDDLKKEAAARQPEMVESRARLTDALVVKAEIRELQNGLSALQVPAASLKDEIDMKSIIADKAAKELVASEANITGLSVDIDALKVAPEYRLRVSEGIKLENEAKAAHENVKQLEIQFSAIDMDVKGLEEKLEGTRGSLNVLKKKLEDLSLEKQKLETSAPDDRAALQKQRDELNGWQAVYEAIKLRKSTADGIKEKITGKQNVLKELESKALALQQDETNAAMLLGEYGRALEEKKKEIDQNAAYRLARKLEDNEPCPVCGSMHHPGLAAHMQEEDLSKLEQELEKMKQEQAAGDALFKKAEKACLVAYEQVNSLRGQISQELQELEVKTAELENEKCKLPEKLLFDDLEQVRAELARMCEEADKRVEQLASRDKELERNAQQMKHVNDEFVNERICETGVASELSLKMESLKQMETELNKARHAFDESQKSCSVFLQQLNIASAALEGERIAQNDRKKDALEKQIEQARERLGRDRNDQEKNKSELQALNSDFMKLEMEIGSVQKQKEQKESKLKELAGDFDIEEKIKQINAKLEEYVQLDRKYLQRIKELENDNNEAMKLKSALEKQREIYSETLEADNTRLQAALLEMGFADCEEVEKCLLPKEKQNELQRDIAEYEQTGINIRAQKDILCKKLNSRSITEEEWNGLDSSYKNFMSYKEESVSKHEVAKSSFNSLKVKHEKWLELDGRHKELVNKSGLFAAIQKLLKAEHGKDNSFIDYIAEERLRYVAAKASETLGFMTKFKYALELDTNAGFIIRDNANGGIHRMVTSLSGGETFLTSLSLALALSEQIQLKGQSPLEFFFLDEGFGTLDVELLDTVIDSLERLSSGNRVIGLISHVPELRSRIARRLVVDPPSSQGDGSRLRIEKA